MDSSPACEGNGVPVGFWRREAVAEMTHATVKLAAAAAVAWRGDGVLPEAAVGGGASGERHGR
uniref:DUF834 domain-containing protein n=1 Tax=Oryza sativa subsp. japonica TaxID=39947 RepID=Q6YT78_ORYSJ|nr:hypothetical protein [Oryza sativa Japonica Group]BAD31390.1 hypothetical protein [Oryza sativa Japonica Group]